MIWEATVKARALPPSAWPELVDRDQDPAQVGLIANVLNDGTDTPADLWASAQARLDSSCEGADARQYSIPRYNTDGQRYRLAELLESCSSPFTYRQ